MKATLMMAVCALQVLAAACSSRCDKCAVLPDGAQPASAVCGSPVDPGTCAGTPLRYYHNGQTHTCDLFTYSGCGGNQNNFTSLADCETVCQVTPVSAPCQVEVTDPSLPGVAVQIEADRCRLHTGKRQRFRYHIDLVSPISYRSPDSGGSCGRCGGYTSDPRSLVETAVGDGRLTRYCECAQGCCAPTTAQPVILSAGRTLGEFEWPGLQWQGPSDTGNPLGPPFPTGNFFAQVLFQVPGVGSIDARLPIELFSSETTPAKAACASGGYVYASGASGIPGPGCSRCQCDNGQLVSCTAQTCSDLCPGTAKFAADCASCGPTGGCEIVEYHCLPTCTAPASDCASFGTCVDGVCKRICR